VTIEEEVLNFGSVQCGHSAAALLHVANDSDTTALFQLQLGPGSVFGVDSTCTKLPPHSTHKIPVRFTPRKPVPHCKRIACLAQHQEPLFVYLIGTVYSETVRPVVLQSKHVLDYVTNARTGITKLPPERVAELLKEGRLTREETTGLLQPATTDNHSSLPEWEKTGDFPALPFANYLHSPHDPAGRPHVSVDSQELVFGCVSPHSVSDGKSLHVTNHTLGTVMCVWMTGNMQSCVSEPSNIAFPLLRECGHVFCDAGGERDTAWSNVPLHCPLQTKACWPILL
jgi:hypothetical protein